MQNSQLSLLNSENEELDTIKGTLDRVTFSADDTGYAVLRIALDNKKTNVVAVGTMPSPRTGSYFTFYGKWVQNQKYGEQFHFKSFEETRPESLEGMRIFLGSGIIKGMGRKNADKIVDYFGADTFKVLDNEPERLLEIPRLSKKLIDSVKNSWKEQNDIRELMVFLNPHGIGTNLAVKVYKFYGQEALNIVKNNPYRMAMDITGIGFEKADKFALSFGFEKNSVLRAQAGTLYILMQETDNKGHVYLPFDQLIGLAASKLQIEADIIEEALMALENEERIIIEDFDEHRAVYFSKFHHCETKISFYINRLINNPKVAHFENSEKTIEEVLLEFPISLAEEQRQAVETATKSKLMVLTGGPGTGKTTIINAIIKVFQKVDSRIFLAAPTGRAAKRMSETTKLEAKTIHRLLEYNPSQDGFTKNEDNPLSCSLLIVDESSMIDLLLMYQLIKAIPIGCTVIFVGDVNQLPSVGAGNVLRDFINSDVMPVVELMQIFRQAAKSQIIQNAHKIHEGDMPYLEIDKEGLSDFYFFPEEGENASEKTCKTIVDLVKDRVPKKFKFNPQRDIQVLSPMTRNAGGVEMLNTMLQSALNSSTTPIERSNKVFYLNDKVMQIRNNYDKDVYNGDIGIIVDLDTKERTLLVKYDDKAVHYNYEELDELVLAYAISIHKSQGGEYPCVIISLLMGHHIMLERNLLYTAVTRGRKLVIIVGSKKAMKIAIEKNTIHKRYTKLSQRLSGA